MRGWSPYGTVRAVSRPGDRERAAEPFDTAKATDDDLAAVHEVLSNCHHEVSPLVPYRGLAETVGYLRFPPAGDDRPAWVIASGGGIRGFAAVRRVRGDTTAWLELRVHPAHRRRGAGTALLAAARSYAAASGVRVLLGHYAGGAGAGFCRAAGAEAGQRDVRSALRLDQSAPTVAPVLGYRLVRWTGPCPDRLLVSYAQARAAINDAPHADADDEIWAPERVRDLEAVVARRGRETRVSAVLADPDDGADGDEEVVAFTEMRVSIGGTAVTAATATGLVASADPTPPTSPPMASIEDTAVVRAHRRRGLATWMKADALATLRLQRPDVAFVVTSNAYENQAIRAINERLGFTSTIVWTTAVLPV